MRSARSDGLTVSFVRISVRLLATGTPTPSISSTAASATASAYERPQARPMMRSTTISSASGARYTTGRRLKRPLVRRRRTSTDRARVTLRHVVRIVVHEQTDVARRPPSTVCDDREAADRNVPRVRGSEGRADPREVRDARRARYEPSCASLTRGPPPRSRTYRRRGERTARRAAAPPFRAADRGRAMRCRRRARRRSSSKSWRIIRWNRTRSSSRTCPWLRLRDAVRRQSHPGN